MSGAGRDGAAAFARGSAVLLIDGRSGAGKTQLAARIRDALAAEGAEPELLRVEDLYPGWDGLAAGSLALAGALDREEYEPYDWVFGRFGAPRHIGARSGTASRPLIIEGCGAVTRENLEAAGRLARRRAGHPASCGGCVRSLWVECPDAERRRRALSRDGEMYAPHWERWAAQEDTHYARHRPWALVDRVIQQAG